MKTFSIKVSKHFASKTKLGEVLNKVTNLDFTLLADAAAKGAVWLQKNGKGSILKVRSLHVDVLPADQVTFYFDSHILSYPELSHAECLYEAQLYGVWLKPVGVLAQGTQSGDHTSLLRYVEKQKKKDVFLVHRLDRETEGLMLVAYDSKAAGKLSELFIKNKITKTYQAIVLGSLLPGKKQVIDASLDGKEALTRIEVIDSSEERSLLKIEIETGRLHQIRRHLDGV